MLIPFVTPSFAQTGEEVLFADFPLLYDSGDYDEPSEYGSLQFYGINGSHFEDNYRNQLDSDSKLIYDALYSEYLEAPKSEFIIIPLTKTFADREITRTGNQLSFSEQDSEEIYSWVQKAVQPAHMALLYDHPELCWLYGASTMYGPDFKGFSFPQGATSIIADIVVTDVKIKLSSIYTDTGTKKDMDSAVADAKHTIDASLVKHDSESVVKAIHDYICRTVTYASSDVNSRIYQTPYSAFYGAKTTVCAGYSKAFKLLCEAYGIPCVLVSGTTDTGGAHMWNYVFLEGAWYAVDTTWDDQSIIYYDYFLSGSSTTSPHFGGKTFSEEHVPNGIWSTSKEHVFVYPVLSSTKYAHIHSIVYNEAIKPTPDNNGKRAHYSCSGCGTLYADEEGQNEISLENLIILYGDVNDDGKVNSRDVLKLRQIISGNALPTDYADVNGDGKTNSRDMIAIRKLISGN